VKKQTLALIISVPSAVLLGTVFYSRQTDTAQPAPIKSAAIVGSSDARLQEQDRAAANPVPAETARPSGAAPEPAAPGNHASQLPDAPAPDAPATFAAAPSTRPSQSAGGANPASEPLVVELAPGMRVPAALVEDDTPLSEGQAVALNQLEESFANDITSSLDPSQTENTGAPADPTKTWDTARQRLDERYKAMFGEDAHNAKLLKSAQEALQSKRNSAP
jgi:hypothetical protein